MWTLLTFPFPLRMWTVGLSIPTPWWCETKHMDTTRIFDLWRRTFTSKGGIRSHANRVHKRGLSFHTTTNNSTTAVPDDYSSGHIDHIPDPTLGITDPSSHSVSYDVYKFYMSFNDWTAPIFHTTPVPSPWITSLLKCTQQCIKYVTSSMLTASTIQTYYDHICEVQDNSDYAERFALRRYFQTAAAFIRYCDKRRHAQLCDEGWMGPCCDQSGRLCEKPRRLFPLSHCNFTIPSH